MELLVLMEVMTEEGIKKGQYQEIVFPQGVLRSPSKGLRANIKRNPSQRDFLVEGIIQASTLQDFVKTRKLYKVYYA